MIFDNHIESKVMWFVNDVQEDQHVFYGMVITKSPRRSILSGKLSLRWSLKLKKMMFEGPFLMRIAVRPLKTLNYAFIVKSIFGHLTCNILENQGTSRPNRRRVACFWTAQNMSAKGSLYRVLVSHYFSANVSLNWLFVSHIHIGTWSNIKVWIRSNGVRSASVHPARKAAATKEVLELMPWCMKVSPNSFPYYHRHKRTCSNKSLLYCS